MPRRRLPDDPIPIDRAETPGRIGPPDPELERLLAEEEEIIERQLEQDRRGEAARQRQIDRLHARAAEYSDAILEGQADANIAEFSDVISRANLAESVAVEADPNGLPLTARERAAGVADCTFVRNGEYLITDAENERTLGNYLIYTVQSGPLEGTRVIKRLVRGVWRGFAFLDNTSTPPGGLLLWQRFAEDADEPYVRVAVDMLDYLRSGVVSPPSMMRTTTWAWHSPYGARLASVTPACVVCNHRPVLAVNGQRHCRAHAPVLGNVLIYEDHDDVEDVPEAWRPRRLDRPPTGRSPQPPLLSELGTGEPL